MGNLVNYPMTTETKRLIESMRMKSVPNGYKPIAQSKFIEKIIKGGTNVKAVSKKQKRKYS
jgi:hypothetical protein